MLDRARRDRAAERVPQLTDRQPSAPRITAEEFQELAWQGVPFMRQLGWRLERFAPGDVAVRLPTPGLPRDRHLRDPAGARVALTARATRI